MRDTIDFGIDLGTTNSAIAVAEHDDVTVIKNNDGWDITPSAVWLPKPDLVHVGRRAKERVETDPENAAAEFKLEMGLADARKSFAKAGVRLTPQQLSAEVLKSLRADAAHHTGAPPDAAVITVPAAFTLNQNKATTDAAMLAGFTTACPLVQEPTAAAFAYGFNDADDRAYWMVFDFGGGTFDAAVVSKHDGDLRVLNHAGDPYLGGKLIDWALVERILVPAVSRELGLSDFRRDNPRWLANFAKLKAAAEEAKIHLSRYERADITVDLVGEDGGIEAFEYALSRGELDSTAEPFYARAINLCRRALEESSLGPADVDRLLLVGGVTLSPGLRERLADPRHGLGIELDLSLDPTTVVARGAAIFAGTLRRPQPLKRAEGEFGVELAYEPIATTTTPTVAGRVSGPARAWTGYSVVLSNPEGRPPFTTGRIPLNASGSFATEVDIDKGKTSRFTVELIDDQGAPRPLTPSTLSIKHGEVEFGGVRLAHSLGIQLADRAFAPMLRKGATLPATVREVFHTAAALRRSDAESMIRIPVLQGERSRGDRNREVGELRIRPVDVTIDLPAGTEVEVTFEVDESSLVTVVADVPLVQTQVEAEINLSEVRTPAPEELQALLAETEQRLESLRESAGASADAARRLSRIETEGTVTTAREQVQAAKVDVGAAAAAEERLRELGAELDDVEDAATLPALVAELEGLLAEAERLVDALGDAADRQELSGLRQRAGEAIQARDPVAVRAQIERAHLLLVEVERRGPDWPVKVFQALSTALEPSGRAGGLIREGTQAIANGDRYALEGVNQRLIRMLPKNEQDKIIGLVRR
ncbi:Hsp70 family protein [Nonomuraea sp. FMUSA5-5]|uniref:Hsp70 family protein n=1 Tax=Nonomuraea composti TaxID=2720023 RepID=A0ABX1BHK9_9ACTN|nr:Hsp70 family protein [Nonomuraea sp. FMUSA5-5]NJP97225.1 Hsp70 family protein [Nonomuraea sp. FMUSA5-5]